MNDIVYWIVGGGAATGLGTWLWLSRREQVAAAAGAAGAFGGAGAAGFLRMLVKLMIGIARFQAHIISTLINALFGNTRLRFVASMLNPLIYPACIALDFVMAGAFVLDGVRKIFGGVL